MVKNYNFFIEGLAEIYDTPLSQLKYFEKHNILPIPEKVQIGKRLRLQYSLHYLLKLKQLKTLLDQGLEPKEAAAFLSVLYTYTILTK